MRPILDRKTVAAVTLVAAIMGEASAPVSAQIVLEEIQDEPAWLEVDPIDNTSKEEQVIVLGTIIASGGTWMQVHIGDYNLGQSSYLTFTALDGHVQRHNAQSLLDWHFWSAKFNGSEVEVALHVAPGDVGVFAQIDQVKSPKQKDSVAQEGGVAAICHNFDDRVASADSRVGRIGGCTGWLVSNGTVITAGHCSSVTPGTPMEFNVPPSLPNGRSVMPGPNDQYPVNRIIGSENGGVGADWMVVDLSPTSNGSNSLPAHVRHGFFRMTKLTPNADTIVRVTGYGVDNTPAGPGTAFCINGTNNGNPCAKLADCPGGQCADADCCDPDGNGTEFGCQFNCTSAAYTQQTAIGRMDDLEDDTIEFDVDTMPGVSGGPIVWEETLGYAFGINTHSGCESFLSGLNNHGTHLHRGVLEAALQNYLGANTIYVDWANAGLPSNGSVYEPLHNVAHAVGAVAHGGTIALVAGSYPRAAGNTFIAGAGPDRKAMTFKAPVGTAVIGN